MYRINRGGVCIVDHFSDISVTLSAYRPTFASSSLLLHNHYVKISRVYPLRGFSPINMLIYCVVNDVCIVSTNLIRLPFVLCVIRRNRALLIDFK